MLEDQIEGRRESFYERFAGGMKGSVRSAASEARNEECAPRWRIYVKHVPWTGWKEEYKTSAQPIGVVIAQKDLSRRTKDGTTPAMPHSLLRIDGRSAVVVGFSVPPRMRRSRDSATQSDAFVNENRKRSS